MHAPPPSPPRLPPSLVFAVAEFVADSAAQLHLLARLSREYHALALREARAARQHVCTISTEAIATPQGLEPLYRRLASQPHVPIYELRITMETAYSFWRRLPPVEDDDDDLAATACELLGQFPDLRTLVILRPYSGGRASSGPIVAILHAAAWLCPRLHTLRLPMSLPGCDDNVETLAQYGESVETVLRALVAALPAWHRHGGLTRLVASIPFSLMRDRQAKAAEFLMALATYCPRLERLGSSNKKNRLITLGVVHEEHWHVGLETWAAFCTACTQVTRFDWTNVPFATAFFEVFGRVAKPKLTSLSLIAGRDWNWVTYYQRNARLANGFQETARNPQSALLACPALHDLTVGDDHRECETLFGDAFCETLALHCRQLERFVVVTCRQKVSEPVVTAVNFTDRALVALATLPWLSRVALRTVNVTGDGLFALAAGFAKNEWKRLRVYTLHVGDQTRKAPATTFYDVILRFLTRLAQCDVVPCSEERVVMRVRNGNVDARWPQPQQETLKQLLDLVLRKHRTIGLRVAVTQPIFSSNHHHPLSFHAITDLAFYTKRAAPRLGPSFAAFGDPSFVDVFVDPKTLHAHWPDDTPVHNAGPDDRLGVDDHLYELW